MATEIAILTVAEWLSSSHHHFERVIFNVFLQEDLDDYIRAFQR
jgi:O-acetyl-ADP-ribose deacetylase (regulator of RNase III)